MGIPAPVDTAEAVDMVLTGLSYLAAEPDSIAPYFSAMLGVAPLREDSGSILYRTQRGETVEILRPEALRARYAGRVPACSALSAYGIGLKIAVSELDSCRRRSTRPRSPEIRMFLPLSETEVDGRSGEMFARTPRQTDLAIFDQHVPVGRGDINVPLPDRLLLARMGSSEAAHSPQQIGKNAATLPDMGDDEHSARIIGGNGLRYLPDSVETAGGAADDDHVAVRRMLRALSCHVLFLHAASDSRPSRRPVRSTAVVELCSGPAA